MTDRTIANMPIDELECRTGIVEAVAGGVVTVRILREKSCNACAAKSHCGAMFGSDTILEIHSESSYSVGDRVEVALNPSAILSASSLFFVLPVFLFLVGLLGGYAVAGSLGFNPQWTGFVIGGLLLVAGYTGVWLLSPRMAASQRYEPVITRKVNE